MTKLISHRAILGAASSTAIALAVAGGVLMPGKASAEDCFLDRDDDGVVDAVASGNTGDGHFGGRVGVGIGF